MSSKFKEGTKLETSDYVDALSEAVMRILKYSNNDVFVSKCFSYLKVNTPSHARKEIQNYFQKVIGFANGSIEPKTNPQRSFSQNENCRINDHEPFDNIDFHSACTSNAVSYPVDDAFEDFSFHLYSEQHMPSFESHHSVGQFSSDSFIELANESLGSVFLTSTPYERETACPSFETNLQCALEAGGVDSEDELEVLRCGNHENDEYYNDEVQDINEEIESSYGSLNFSIPDLTEPTASEYSINFSHPEYLNESYLLRDLTDLLGQSDKAVENYTPIDHDMTELSNKEISSQELIDKALLSINESLLADVQDNFHPTIMVAPERPEIVEDFTKDTQDISSICSLHKNYMLNEKQKNEELKSTNNFETDESDCLIVYDASKIQAVTEVTMINNNNNNNNNSHNLECNDVDLILTCEYSSDSSEIEKLSENSKLDSETEKVSTEEKLLPSSENLREKSVENIYDYDDMENQYECYFDSNSAVALENIDEKSTEEEDTDDSDDEPMPFLKDEVIVIKTI